MATSMFHANNTLKCAMCNKNMINGIVCDGLYYCDTNCHINKFSLELYQSQAEWDARASQMAQDAKMAQALADRDARAAQMAQDAKMAQALADRDARARHVHFGGVSYAPSAPHSDSNLTVTRSTPTSSASSARPTSSSSSARPSSSASSARSGETYHRSYGTCASCTNTYGSCATAIEQDGKWFCGKTCCSMYASSQRMAQFPPPAVMFPFASTTYTMFPISVNPSSGKIYF
jgi:hypothetical protein